MRLVTVLACAFLLTACSVEDAGQETPSFPYFTDEGGRVRDLADVLSPAFEAELTSRLNSAERSYGQQMAVVTVPDLHGYSIDDFSLAYANEWGLGDADRNDGLMILLAPNERRVRIEIGLGLENDFPDDFCQQVIDDQMLTAFVNGNYEGGISAGTDALIARMHAYPSIPANDNQKQTQAEDAA